MNRLCACVTALFLIAPSISSIASARDKDPLNIEDGVLDEIHLKVPTISAGVPILIRSFSTEAVDLGTAGAGSLFSAWSRETAEEEGRLEAAKTLVKLAPELLIEAFKSSILKSHAFGELLAADVARVPKNALVIEGRFTRIDPGSSAKRYWSGWGAGKTSLQVRGTVKDASGTVLAEFTHMKHSGYIDSCGYVECLSYDAKDIGHDVAIFLIKWAARRDLH